MEVSGLCFVKKIQRSFVVEYKSGRRKTDPKSNSIWGDMDLRSVARNVQEAALPFLTSGPDGVPSCEVSISDVECNEPLLMPSIGHPTMATTSREPIMADENNTKPDDRVPATIVAAIEKQRKPRAKKPNPETSAAEVVIVPAAILETPPGRPGKQTRRGKFEAVENASRTKSGPVKRPLKTEQPAAAAPTAIIGEIADLVQLEEENQKLRKLLAEKLRAENADLRRRLDLR